jgi:hypothetical protein
MQQGELRVLRTHVEGELHRGANSSDMRDLVAGVFASVREERVATASNDQLALRATPSASRKRKRLVEIEPDEDSGEEYFRL